MVYFIPCLVRHKTHINIDELVKSRTIPSPSMGEGWGEGE